MTTEPAEKTAPVAPFRPARDNPRLGILLMIGSTVLFALLWTLVKILSDRYPIAEVSFFRSVLALIPVGVLITMHGGARLLRPHRLRAHVWRSVIGVTSMILGFLSYHLMPLADAVAISFTSPLMITALSVPLLGEKVGPYRWCAVVVGFGGVLMIVQPSGSVFNLGALSAIGAAVASAFAMVTIRQLNRTDPPLTIVFYFTLFSSIFTALPLPFVWITPAAADWGWMALMGLAGGFGQYLMTRAFGLASAAVISPLNYVSLLWASLFGWAIWNDIPTPHVFAGSAVVVASGLFILYREGRKRSQATDGNE
ncbi:DMT family transporter [Telmatospirillum sp.]|uniref:DMT family transporter n=1 Tax=Telmatospirillum sp. TaxID=2079197 RepID=UPI00283B4EBE|nr:DMT family transporter [Telmatospirillum sp.]MDR3440386.1 DMT family transporter [Telmatospirillum sp.]